MSDRIEGNWLQFKGKVKEQWGKLTDDDLDVIASSFRNLRVLALQNCKGAAISSSGATICVVCLFSE